MAFKRNIKLLRWHSFFTDFSLWAPLAIIYFSRVSGSYTLGISIFSVAMISSAIFELPTGFISDKYGRVKTLIFGATTFVLSGIFYAIGLNYWFLIIGAILGGLGRSFYSGNNNALLYDNLIEDQKVEDFAEYNGKIGSMSQIALAIAGLSGGIIAYFSFPILMWLSVIPPIVCLILGLNLIEAKSVSNESENIFIHIGQAFKNFISNFKLRQISLVNIIEFGMGEAAWNFRSAFVATLWPIWAIGIAQVLSNIGAAFSFHFSGRIIKKFTAIKILFFNFIASKTIDLTLLIFPSVLSPALMSSTSLLYGTGSVSKEKLLQNEFTNKERATMGSLNSLFGSLFFGFFAIILGLLADKFGPRQALIIEVLLSFIILIPLYRFKKAHDQLSR